LLAPPSPVNHEGHSSQTSKDELNCPALISGEDTESVDLADYTVRLRQRSQKEKLELIFSHEEIGLHPKWHQYEVTFRGLKATGKASAKKKYSMHEASKAMLSLLASEKLS